MKPSTPRSRRIPLPPLVLGLLALPACATTGSTFGSGVGDRFLEHPPYYAGAAVTPAAAIGHLPVRYQRGGAGSELDDPRSGTGSAVEALLREINAALDGLGVSERLADSAVQPPGAAPDVQFGCVLDGAGNCDGERRVDPDHRIRMRLAVGRPSRGWTEWARDAAAADGADAILVITLEVGQYWIQPHGWRNDKTVELGTDHAMRLPWLTSLETPVPVLQLTGALVDLDGRAIRIGAEGLLARRTDLIRSSFGLQRTISDRDVEQLRTSRRDDLPGHPLVWEAALRQLVAGLTGEQRVAAR